MNRPLRLAVCFVGVSWLNVYILRSVRWVISWVLVGYSQNVRNVFVICTLHIRHAKVGFLPCKSMVFGVQKGGFHIAKVWFLFFECYVVANR